MTTYDVPHPPIVSREQWLVARKKLLAQEKELTRQYDRVNAVRRRLPMVRIVKNYMFEGPGGEESLLDLFDTTFVMVSRAPRSKLEAYKERQGWPFTWVSSLGSEFNYDFHVTNDEKIAPVEYNYRNKADLEANNVPNAITGEEHGLSVFFRIGEHVFHTYSAYARGTEALTDARAMLDVTPYGRQQDFEESPPGWPQRPTYG